MDTFCAFLSCASTWIGNISIITSLIETYLGGTLSALVGGGCSTIIDQSIAFIGPPIQSCFTTVGSIISKIMAAIGV